MTRHFQCDVQCFLLETLSLAIESGIQLSISHHRERYMQMGLTERDLDEVKDCELAFCCIRVCDGCEAKLEDFMFRQPLHIMAIMQAGT